MHVPNEAKRAYAVKPFYRGKKVTVIGAISIKRVVALMTIDNSMDGKAFEIFTLKMFSATIVVGSSSSDG
jgi:hypothetical protein